MAGFRCKLCKVEYAVKPKKCETPKCKGTMELKLDTVAKLNETILDVGGNYRYLGVTGSTPVYGRLNRTELLQLKAGAALDYDAYESSMLKGIIPSGSTGKDGVKKEPFGWVIKMTISQAKATGGDNTVSPVAEEMRDGKNIRLDFRSLAARH